MKKLTSTIGKIVFYAFVVVVALFTASLTLSELQQILPGDTLTPIFALSLFDGGTLAWLAAWTGHARGMAQRSIAAIMLVIDLLGVVLLSSARMFTGGQTLTDAPAMIGAYVIWGIVGATLCNLAAVYAFHVFDVAVMEAIETGILTDTLRSEAMKQAQANIEAQAQQLGAIMAARATGQLKYNLRLPMSADEAQHVIDAPQQQPETPGILSQWMTHTAQQVTDAIQPRRYQAATATGGVLAPVVEPVPAGGDVNFTQPETTGEINK